jgi:hypothetical protein
VLARVLLLLLAAGAAAAGAWLGGRAGSETERGARYACPMHPEMVATRPGQCSICGMALEPLRLAGAHGSSSHADDLLGMTDLTAVENVRKHKILDVVRMQSLLMNVRELRGGAWVEDDGAVTALFYKDQIDALGLDEPGAFSCGGTSQLTVAVRRLAEPAQPWDRSVSRIRFAAVSPRPGGEGAPCPHAGQVGWVQLAYKMRAVLTVPASALLQSPEGPYVLVASGGSRFEKRSIEIGETFLKQGFAVVLSGLRVQERVVSRAAFFIDAERRLAALGER